MLRHLATSVRPAAPLGRRCFAFNSDSPKSVVRHVSYGLKLDMYDDMSRKDTSAKENHGNYLMGGKLGPKIHRTFMPEVGEEVCQCEIAHHANK